MNVSFFFATNWQDTGNKLGIIVSFNLGSWVYQLLQLLPAGPVKPTG